MHIEGNTALAAEPTVALAIPRAGTEIVPPGFATEIFAPVAMSLPWEELDEAESQLLAMASYVDSMQGDVVEYEKCLRIIEYRRGVLLGAGQQGARTDLQPFPSVEEVDVAPATASRYRSIARAWDDVVWPFLLDAKERRDVTQAAILRVAKGEHNHRAQGTGENEWYTPPRYIELARDVMGGIDLDPASSDMAQQSVGALAYFTVADDGLAKEWSGRVWMNPPYSQPAILHFIEKLVGEVTAGRVTQAIALTHNYTDTAWFHLAANACTAICLTRGRIGFVSPTGEKAAPTQGQAFFYFGDRPDVFAEKFAAVGLIVRPA